MKNSTRTNTLLFLLVTSALVGSSIFSGIATTRQLYRTAGLKRETERSQRWSSKNLFKPERTPAQRCDYTFDEEVYPSFYDDECWKRYSVDDWRRREGGASRALLDHGAAYLKNILEYEEAKVLREYLVGELSPKTLDGKEYYIFGLRNSTGRYDLTLDPTVQEPVMNALNKVTTRLRPTLDKILGSNATLFELSVYATCHAGQQQRHRDAISFWCGAGNSFKDRPGMVVTMDEEKGLVVIKPSHYENSKCANVYSIFIALQPTTQGKNGVTFIYPGSHLYLPRNESVDPETFQDRVTGALNRCEPAMNTGDGFVYNSNTLHGANSNPSRAARMMLVISFRSDQGKLGQPLSGNPYGSVNHSFVRLHPVPVDATKGDNECQSYSCLLDECSPRYDCLSGECRPRYKKHCLFSSGKVLLDEFPTTTEIFKDLVASP